MNWSGRDAFAKSVKRIWRMGSNDHDRPSLVKEGDDVTVSKGVVAGFVNEVWPLIRVGVMHAGHLAPMEYVGAGLVQRFIF